MSYTRMRVNMEYAAVGNRTRINTFASVPQTSSTDAVIASGRYIKYDGMNRQTVVDAVTAIGILGSAGHAITYDVNGSRIEDKFQGNRVTTVSGYTLTAFATVNATLMKYTGGSLALLRPNIYIGTNPATDNGYARIVAAPKGSEDLTVLDNRVNIARNGFNTLNAMRQVPSENALIKFHQNQLGHSNGLVQMPKPLWSFKL